MAYNPEFDPYAESVGGYDPYSIGETTAGKKPDEGDFGAGFGAGVESLKSLGYAAAAAFGDLIGSDPMRDWGMEGYLEHEKLAEEAGEGRITQLEQIGGPGDFIDYAQYTMGQLAPFMLESVAGAIAGSIAGSAAPGAGTVAGSVLGALGKKKLKGLLIDYAKKETRESLSDAQQALARRALSQFGATAGLAAASYPVAVGDVYGETVKAGDPSPKVAFAAGVPYAAIDLVPEIGLLKAFAAGPTAKGIIRAATSQAGKTSILEGLSEEGQEEILMLTRSALDPEFDYAGEEAWSRRANAAAAGAIGGFGAGGVTGVAAQVNPQERLKEFQRDENGNFVLDENGSPVPVLDDAGKAVASGRSYNLEELAQLVDAQEKGARNAVAAQEATRLQAAVAAQEEARLQAEAEAEAARRKAEAAARAKYGAIDAEIERLAPEFGLNPAEPVPTQEREPAGGAPAQPFRGPRSPLDRVVREPAPEEVSEYTIQREQMARGLHPLQVELEELKGKRSAKHRERATLIRATLAALEDPISTLSQRLQAQRVQRTGVSSSAGVETGSTAPAGRTADEAMEEKAAGGLIGRLAAAEPGLRISEEGTETESGSTPPGFRPASARPDGQLFLEMKDGISDEELYDALVRTKNTIRELPEGDEREAAKSLLDEIHAEIVTREKSSKQLTKTLSTAAERTREEANAEPMRDTDIAYAPKKDGELRPFQNDKVAKTIGRGILRKQGLDPEDYTLVRVKGGWAWRSEEDIKDEPRTVKRVEPVKPVEGVPKTDGVEKIAPVEPVSPVERVEPVKRVEGVPPIPPAPAPAPAEVEEIPTSVDTRTAPTAPGVLPDEPVSTRTRVTQKITPELAEGVDITGDIQTTEGGEAVAETKTPAPAKSKTPEAAAPVATTAIAEPTTAIASPVVTPPVMPGTLDTREPTEEEGEIPAAVDTSGAAQEEGVLPTEPVSTRGRITQRITAEDLREVYGVDWEGEDVQTLSEEEAAAPPRPPLEPLPSTHQVGSEEEAPAAPEKVLHIVTKNKKGDGWEKHGSAQTALTRLQKEQPELYAGYTVGDSPVGWVLYPPSRAGEKPGEKAYFERTVGAILTGELSASVQGLRVGPDEVDGIVQRMSSMPRSDLLRMRKLYQRIYDGEKLGHRDQEVLDELSKVHFPNATPNMLKALRETIRLLPQRIAERFPPDRPGIDFIPEGKKQSRDGEEGFLRTLRYPYINQARELGRQYRAAPEGRKEGQKADFKRQLYALAERSGLNPQLHDKLVMWAIEGKADSDVNEFLEKQAAIHDRAKALLDKGIYVPWETGHFASSMTARARWGQLTTKLGDTFPYMKNAPAELVQLEGSTPQNQKWGLRLPTPPNASEPAVGQNELVSQKSKARGELGFQEAPGRIYVSDNGRYVIRRVDSQSVINNLEHSDKTREYVKGLKLPYVWEITDDQSKEIRFQRGIQDAVDWVNKQRKLHPKTDMGAPDEVTYGGVMPDRDTFLATGTSSKVTLWQVVGKDPEFEATQEQSDVLEGIRDLLLGGRGREADTSSVMYVYKVAPISRQEPPTQEEGEAQGDYLRRKLAFNKAKKEAKESFSIRVRRNGQEVAVPVESALFVEARDDAKEFENTMMILPDGGIVQVPRKAKGSFYTKRSLDTRSMRQTGVNQLEELSKLLLNVRQFNNQSDIKWLVDEVEAAERAAIQKAADDGKTLEPLPRGSLTLASEVIANLAEKPSKTHANQLEEIKALAKQWGRALGAQKGVLRKKINRMMTEASGLTREQLSHGIGSEVGQYVGGSAEITALAPESRAAVERMIGMTEHPYKVDKAVARYSQVRKQLTGMPVILEVSRMQPEEYIEAKAAAGESAIRVRRRGQARKVSPLESPAFRRWFRDSKVVDENGEPLVVYHGTPKNFSTFEKQPGFPSGFFFAPDPEKAERYGGNRRDAERGGLNIMPVYLSLQNPVEVQMGEEIPGIGEPYYGGIVGLEEDLAALGHDGVIVRDSDGRVIEYIALRPDQIKSAIGNNGEFGLGNPDFLASRLDSAPEYGSDPDALQQEVARVTEGWKNAPGVEVVTSRGELPEHLQDDASDLDAAVFDPSTGTVWMIAEAIEDPSMVMPLMMHEGVVHYGVEVLSQDKAGQNRVTLLLKAVANKHANSELGKKIQGLYNFDLDTKEGRTLFGNEVLAHLAETDPQASFVQRAVALVMEFIRGIAAKMGIEYSITEAETLALLGDMKKAVIDKDGARPTSNGAPMFKRQQHYSGLEVDEVKALRRINAIRDEPLGLIAWGKKLVSTLRTADAAAKAEMAAWFRTKAFDRMYGVDVRTQQFGRSGIEPEFDGYKALRMTTGTAVQVKAIMEHGTPEMKGGVMVKKDDGGLIPRLMEDENGKPLLDSPEMIDRWVGWMTGQRARSLRAVGKEKFIPPELEKKLIEIGEKSPEMKARMEKARDRYHYVLGTVIDMAVSTGRLDSKTGEVWKANSFYIPFYRLMDNDVQGPTGKSKVAGASPFKKLTGRLMQTNNPLDNIALNISALVGEVNMNAAIEKVIDNLTTGDAKDYGVRQTDRGQMGYKIMELQGKEDKGTHEMTPDEVADAAAKAKAEMIRRLQEVGWESDEIQAKIDSLADADWAAMGRFFQKSSSKNDDMVRVYRNGKAHFYKVHDPLLLHSLQNVQLEAGGAVRHVSRTFKRLLTRAVTADPGFMGRNFIRDSVHARTIVDPRYNLKFGVDSVRGLASAWREDGAAQDMDFAGASFFGGFAYGTDPDAVMLGFRRSLHDKGLSAEEADDFLGSIVLNTKELFKRLERKGAAFENANREAMHKAVMEATGNRALAAYESKDLMDYSMIGSWKMVQVANDMFPFFNARMQGLYKLYRNGKAFKQAVLARGAVMMSFTLALLALNWGNDDYEKLKDWDKDQYFHFFPGTEFHTRLPKPFEVGVLFGTIPERITRATFGKDTPKELMMRLFWNTEQAVAFNPIPQIARPLVESTFNYDLFRQAPIEGMVDQGKMPSARYSAYTSDLMKAVFHDAMLGDTRLGDLLGVSPKKAEYIIKGYTGTLGGYALMAADAGYRLMTGAPDKPDAPGYAIPILGSFLRGKDEPRSTKYHDELYSMWKEVEEVYRTISAMKKEGDYEEAERLMNVYQEKLAHRGRLTSTKNRLTALKRQIDEITRDPLLSGEEKGDMLDELYRAGTESAKDATEGAKGVFR